MELTEDEHRQLALAKKSLLDPPVQFSHLQINLVALAIQEYLEANPATIWACSILPDHVHMVVARHRLKMEQLIRLFKGEATRKLLIENQHPLMGYRDRNWFLVKALSGELGNNRQCY